MNFLATIYNGSLQGSPVPPHTKAARAVHTAAGTNELSSPESQLRLPRVTAGDPGRGTPKQPVPLSSRPAARQSAADPLAFQPTANTQHQPAARRRKRSEHSRPISPCRSPAPRDERPRSASCRCGRPAAHRGGRRRAAPAALGTPVEAAAGAGAAGRRGVEREPLGNRAVRNRSRLHLRSPAPRRRPARSRWRRGPRVLPAPAPTWPRPPAAGPARSCAWGRWHGPAFRCPSA